MSGINPEGKTFSIEKEDIQARTNDGSADGKAFLVF